MDRAPAGVARRMAVATVAAACAVLVLVPGLQLTAAEESGTLALALVTVAFAALVRLDLRSVAHAGAGARSAMCPTSDAVPPVPTAGATDHRHHPLRPRAPGMA